MPVISQHRYRRKNPGKRKEKKRKGKKSKALKTSLLPGQTPQRRDLDMLACSLGTKEEEESWGKDGRLKSGAHDSTCRDGESDCVCVRACVCGHVSIIFL